MSNVPAPKEVESYLRENLSYYLDILQRMVSINSFTANPRGVNALAELTADVFAELGFEDERVQSADYLYGEHLILTRPGMSADPGEPVPLVGLISHLDTVYPAIEEETNDFHWRVEGDRLYGPGTVDIKGGTVMIYVVLDTLRQLYPELYDRVTWRIMLNAAEEALNIDFGDLCLEKLEGALAALIFEGGDMQNGREFHLVTARKGMARYHITVEGKAAHAGSSHDQGANAIVQLADVIQQIASYTDYNKAITFNVGTVMGGTVINRVPHQASSSVEMRAFDPDVFESGVDKMLALNQYCSVRSYHDGYPCQVRVVLSHRWEPWAENESTERLFAAWHEAAESLGLVVLPEARGGLSDGNLIWRDLPTLDGLGPTGANAHCSQRSEDGSKDQEYVLASSYVPKALLNVTAIVKLLGG